MTPHEQQRGLDRARILYPEERTRIRAHAEGQLALAKAQGAWRAYRDSVFVLLLLATGIRVGAACKIRCGDLILGRGQREILIRRAKGGRPRRVRIPDDLRSVLLNYVAAFPSPDSEAALFPGTMAKPAPMSRSTGWRRWKRTLQATGLDARGRGCHAARHGLGLALYKNTGDLRLVAAQLGHRDLRSTLIYTAPMPEDVDRALDAAWPKTVGVLDA